MPKGRRSSSQSSAASSSRLGPAAPLPQATATTAAATAMASSPSRHDYASSSSSTSRPRPRPRSRSRESGGSELRESNAATGRRSSSSTTSQSQQMLAPPSSTSTSPRAPSIADAYHHHQQQQQQRQAESVTPVAGAAPLQSEYSTPLVGAPVPAPALDPASSPFTSTAAQRSHSNSIPQMPTPMPMPLPQQPPPPPTFGSPHSTSPHMAADAWGNVANGGAPPISMAQTPQPPPPLSFPSRAASLPGTTRSANNANGTARQRGGSQTPNYNNPGGAIANAQGLSPNSAATAALLGMHGGNVNGVGAPPHHMMANHHANALPLPSSHHHHHYNAAAAVGPPPPPLISHERYVAELTNCIIAFLSPQLPTEEEYRIKEATRRQLERLAGKVIPGARLLAFGSMANGFALKNSDMDLCCLTAETAAEAANGLLPASELVEKMAQVLRAETDFNVYALPKARIPIIKISRPASAERPYEVACDIGFENRLALENTRLLLSYAMVDPPRLRTLVLFLKVWTKRRKLNSPYMGTLSSYGYTLLVLFFLMHVKRPNVLPNLQRIPPTRPLTQDEIEVNGHNTYFYDDVTALKREWATQNTENVAELLIDFFRYFAKEFAYSRDVISIKTDGGLLAKDGLMWNAELCIEDPFQSGYNVSRTVTKDGLYTIRGEFMRATRILANRHQRVSTSLTELCEEREDIVARAPDTPPTRHRYAPAQTGAVAGMHAGYRRGSQLNAGGGPGASASASGFGGSLAFEEMARGLGRQRGAGHGGMAAAYPTTAMLAPLSQNGGLSPRPRAMGLRGSRERDLSTPAPVRAVGGIGSGGGMSGGPQRGAGATSTHHLMSSARSDDGGGGGGDGDDNATPKAMRSRTTHASARTSPTFAPAVPHGLPHTNDVGEAWAFGSEISFGSERFRLHGRGGGGGGAGGGGGGGSSVDGKGSKDQREQPRRYQQQRESSGNGNGNTSADNGNDDGANNSPAAIPSSAATRTEHRTSRSFSDGVNRRATSTTGAQSPPSGGGGLHAHAQAHAHGLHAAMAALRTSGGPSGGGGYVSHPHARPHGVVSSTVGTSSGRMSPSAGAGAGDSDEDNDDDDDDTAMMTTSTMEPMMQEYTAAWAQNQLQHARDEGDDNKAGGYDQQQRLSAHPTMNGGSYDAASTAPVDAFSSTAPVDVFSSTATSTAPLDAFSSTATSNAPLDAYSSTATSTVPLDAYSSPTPSSSADANDEADASVPDEILDELSRISHIEAEGRGRHSRNSSYAEAKLGFGVR